MDSAIKPGSYKAFAITREPRHCHWHNHCEGNVKAAGGAYYK